MTPLERALKLLAARARTEKELDAALAKAGVPERERDEVLARVKELGYIDDRETARGRARTRIEQGDGPRRARQRLVAQGIGEADATAAVAEAAGGAGEEELAARALRRKLRGRVPADGREKRRLLRALIGKGHRPSAAAKALGIDWEGDDDFEE